MLILGWRRLDISLSEVAASTDTGFAKTLRKDLPKREKIAFVGNKTNKQTTTLLLLKMATPCCPTDVKPVGNNYKGTGKAVSIPGHFDMYVAGVSEGIGACDFAVINVYDIFGCSGHTEQFADRLAEAAGCIVCVPDLIGDAWSPENVPPSKQGKFPAGVEPEDGVDVLVHWILNHHNTRADRSEAFQAIKDYLAKEYSIQKVGAVGMCWGAKVCWNAANKGLVDAVAGCHASFLEVADVENLSIPQCLLNSKDEPESYKTDLKPILDKSDKNFFKHFPTMHHGWMGTRGIGDTTDFSREEVANKFKEALADLTAFFKKSLA